MGFLIRLACLLLLLFLLRLLFRYLYARYLAPRGSSAQNPPTISGRVFKDPQCGTYVAEEIAFEVHTSSQVHYFCSAECRDRYLKKLA